MRILVYTLEFIPFAGGIATFCYELAVGLSRLGQKVTVVAPRVGQVDESVLPFSVRWIPAHRSRIARMVLSLWSLHRAVAEVEPDVILVTQQYALLSVALFRRWLPINTIPMLHGSEILWHAQKRGIAHRVVADIMSSYYKSRELIICGSSYAQSLVVNSFRIRSTDSAVVYYGMRNRFDPTKHDGDEIRQKLGLDAGTIVLLTVARLVPRKGQDVLIRALPAVIRCHPTVVYLCVGEGPYRKRLEETVETVGVEDRVIFVGRVSDSEKYSYYAASDLFIMLSRRVGNTVEGFGLSFLEAWHASKPVLGGRHGGVVEVIDDGVNGLIVDPQDEREVARVLNIALNDQETLRRMGIHGHQKSETFSQLSMARSLLSALNTRLGSDDDAVLPTVP